MGRGLKGHDRTPREDPRARRNAQRFAGDAGSMFSGALAVDDEGLIVLNLQADGGLSQDATGLTVVVTAPIALDAGGVHLDYGTGLQVVGDTLTTKDSEIVHDDLQDDTPNQHIDWTNTTEDLKTTGTAETAQAGIGIAPLALCSLIIAPPSGYNRGIYTSLVNTEDGAKILRSSSAFIISSGAIGAFPVTLYASQLGIENNQTIDVAASDVKIYGQYIDIGGAPTITAGELNHYNQYLTSDSDLGVVGTTRKYLTYGIISGTADSHYGLWLDVSGATNNYGIILQRDGLGGGILFGRGIDSSISYDGSHLWIDSDRVGTGSLKIGAAANHTEIKPDGEINLAGTARVKRTSWLGANAVKDPPTKPAVFVDHGIAGAWQFTDGTDDSIVGSIKVPEDMDITVAPSVKIGWSSTATSLVGRWQLEYLWRSANEDTTVAAQETLTIDVTSSAVAEGFVLSEFTGVDLPNSSDICWHFRLKRMGAAAEDTLGVDAELHGICLEYTANKLGTAT